MLIFKKFGQDEHDISKIDRIKNNPNNNQTDLKMAKNAAESKKACRRIGRPEGLLTVFALKLLHKVDEPLHSLFAHRIINRGANTAHRAMAFQTREFLL